jgi:hypothetical protein
MSAEPRDVRCAQAVMSFVLLVLLAACDASTMEPAVPAALQISTGDGQMAAAGRAVSVVPAVLVHDQRGRPVPGARVSFAVASGGGTAGAASTTTDMRGLATPGQWRLGTRAGANTLIATVAGLPPVTFTAMATAGEPARIMVHGGDAQSAVVQSRVAAPPAVRVVDLHDNPVAGVAVTFAAGAASGLVTGGERITDAAGVAAVDAWTLGGTAGEQTLLASVSGLAPVAFRATALPTVPSGLTIVSGDQQSGTVGTSLQAPLAVLVRDAHGNATGGVTVQFDVVTGGGRIVGAIQAAAAGAESITSVADAEGVARVAQWVLGTSAGSNTVRASAEGVAEPVIFSATGRAGPPLAMTSHDGDQQTALPGAVLPVQPAVRVRDAFDNGVPGVTVRFTVTAGGGSVTGELAVTDGTGVAAVGSWTLGSATGANALLAEAAGLEAISFAATAGQTGGGGGSGGGGGGSGGEPGGYDLEVRYTSNVTAAQRGAVDGAAARWASIIQGDLPAVPMTIAAGACGVPHAALNEQVDDLLVFVHIAPIDGPGKVLGSAGPCYIRSASGLPIVGAVLLDEADVTAMLNNGSLGDVVLHELGHVLGVGTLWSSNVLVGEGGADPYFIGVAARSAFQAAGGSSYAGNAVPVENTGSGGTRDAHWRESVLGAELMTGWISGGGNPLSAITIGSLGDIGYSVDTGAADPYFVAGGAAAQSISVELQRIHLEERTWTIRPIPVDQQGRRN